MESMIKKLDTTHQLSWKRPIEQRVKTDLDKQMAALLRDASIDDSIKSKLLAQTLTKFQHIGKKVPAYRQDDVSETSDVGDLIDFSTPPSPQKRLKQIKKKTKVKKPKLTVDDLLGLASEDIIPPGES